MARAQDRRPRQRRGDAVILEALHSGAHVVSEISVDGKTERQMPSQGSPVRLAWRQPDPPRPDTRGHERNRHRQRPRHVWSELPRSPAAAGAVLEVIRREIEVSCKVVETSHPETSDTTSRTWSEAVTIGDLPIP